MIGNEPIYTSQAQYDRAHPTTSAKDGNGRVDTNASTTTHQTYQKTNEKTGEVYSGKTSGKGTPEQNVANRDKKPDHQQKNEDGYGPAKLEQSSTNKSAVRGREQQLIDKNGGAKSQGGTSGNKIQGIRNANPHRQECLDAAKKEFGNL